MSFVDFYRLDPGTTQGQVRRMQLEDLLNTFPPCNCGLSAIPQGRCNVFREMKGHAQTTSARSHFENHKDSIFHNIVGKRLLLGPSAILYPSITDVASEQAMLCHIVPIQANGCKSSPDNIRWRLEMCPLCQNLDKLFTNWQGA
jgi:hypothetical protein